MRRAGTLTTEKEDSNTNADSRFVSHSHDPNDAQQTRGVCSWMTQTSVS